MTPSKYIWHNGKLVDWSSATVHVMAHGLHYGTSIFEGIRCYETPSGPAIFRLQDHIRRLFDSAKIYWLEIPWTPDEISEACRLSISANELKSAYIRPIVFLGAGTLSLNGIGKCPVEVSVGAFPWGAYHGSESIEHGIDACISSWSRTSNSSLPVLAKAGGHYLNSQLVCMEANRNGFAEGITLNRDGLLAEGSGENVFVVRDGKLMTPPLSSSILGGITRDTVMQLSHSLGIDVREQAVPRELLYIADEIFMTGTAAEITPVRSVDRIPVGTGKPGPVTQSLQREFFGLFDGSRTDSRGWLDHVNSQRRSAIPAE
jgi:branched-chain amino acid aminotransferase